MQTFLGKTADHLFQSHSIEELRDIAVVMPSQRGILYLKKELAIRGDRPFLSPSFFTIEEFALQMTDSVLEDPIDLLFEAYTCFKEVDPNTDFDRFATWGQMMLKDFDTLDLYLVDPSSLFTFLSEAKSIERWGEEYGEEQAGTWITPNTQAYFKLYDSLLEVYIRLKSRLEVKGTTYRGLAYRKLVELLEAGKSLGFKQIYFVGFNALSKSEESIIRLLLKENVAQTLWDVDEYYLKNRFHRAGNWLRDYSNPGNPAYLSRGAFHWMERD
jgi:ATP-dependent helicase/nuclease subunit B